MCYYISSHLLLMGKDWRGNYQKKKSPQRRVTRKCERKKEMSQTFGIKNTFEIQWYKSNSFTHQLELSFAIKNKSEKRRRNLLRRRIRIIKWGLTRVKSNDLNAFSYLHKSVNILITNWNYIDMDSWEFQTISTNFRHTDINHSKASWKNSLQRNALEKAHRKIGLTTNREIWDFPLFDCPITPKRAINDIKIFFPPLFRSTFIQNNKMFTCVIKPPWTCLHIFLFPSLYHSILQDIFYLFHVVTFNLYGSLVHFFSVFFFWDMRSGKSMVWNVFRVLKNSMHY